MHDVRVNKIQKRAEIKHLATKGLNLAIKNFNEVIKVKSERANFPHLRTLRVRGKDAGA